MDFTYPSTYRSSHRDADTCTDKELIRTELFKQRESERDIALHPRRDVRYYGLSRRGECRSQSGRATSRNKKKREAMEDAAAPRAQ